MRRLAPLGDGPGGPGLEKQNPNQSNNQNQNARRWTEVQNTNALCLLQEYAFANSLGNNSAIDSLQQNRSGHSDSVRADSDSVPELYEQSRVRRPNRYCLAKLGKYTLNVVGLVENGGEVKS
mmetsp:Transcript_42711/g.68657  ORF Transcript_42711/g.68657 Transcript_42711/m.68657 type:complete len:122 (-) Transcript_42711:754-1119(-)